MRPCCPCHPKPWRRRASPSAFAGPSGVARPRADKMADGRRLIRYARCLRAAPAVRASSLRSVEPEGSNRAKRGAVGVPTGIRTPVLTVKGWCPNRARRWGPSAESGKLRAEFPRARIFSCGTPGPGSRSFGPGGRGDALWSTPMKARGDHFVTGKIINTEDAEVTQN